MHGIVLVGMKNFISSTFGDDVWMSMLKDTDIGVKAYMATITYPDEEVRKLVKKASELTGKSEKNILEEFGRFIASTLIDIYGMLIDPSWRTMDLIEHTGGTIHKTVRLKTPGAAPPEISSKRVSPGEVVVTYGSPRRMCGFAMGLARGIADHYGDRVVINESRCMLEGSPSCNISIRLVEDDRGED